MSETWVNLGASDVLSDLAPAEAAMLQAVSGSDGRLTDIIARVVEQVRDAYRCGGRMLGDEGMVPASLAGRAADLARWQYLTSFPRLAKLQTTERKEHHDDALRFLARIAEREIKSAGGAEMVTRTRRQATRKRLDGL